KTLSLLITLLTTLSLHASGCFKELCPDDVVRVIYGWKGSVVDFNIDRESVNVLLHHNGYVFEFPYKELGKSVWCHEGFCLGQELVDQYGNDIIVEEVYTHQMLYAFNLNIDGYALYSFDELRGN